MSRARSDEAAAFPEIARALEAFPALREPRAAPLSSGLIHQSFSVCDGDARYVLQRVSPIFSLSVHDNIAAVTEHLHRKGVPTPRLLATRRGQPYADLGDDGVWRLMTGMPGVCFDTCQSPEQARSAGALVARFHSALADLDCEFQPLGIPLHDTAAHLAGLERALSEHRDHRLHAAVAPLADEILGTARAWEPLHGLPRRVIHGDLKFNNVLFAGESGAARRDARCLIDLDTVSRLPLYLELGDAWRSWCNRRGEDAPEAELDLALFEACAEGYLGALNLELGAAERASLVHGLERISLELAARFAADALRESYFGWDPARFGSAGDHNLTRARGQLSLHRQAHQTRPQRATCLSRG